MSVNAGACHPRLRIGDEEARTGCGVGEALTPQEDVAQALPRDRTGSFSYEARAAFLTAGRIATPGAARSERPSGVCRGGRGR